MIFAQLMVCLLALRAAAGDTGQRYFMCVFGPDSSGAYYEEIVPEKLAKKCDMFCVCQDLKTTCLLGPDSLCNYATVTVDHNYASSCDRSSCTCTSHTDYMKVANQRLSSSQVCLDQLTKNAIASK